MGGLIPWRVLDLTIELRPARAPRIAGPPSSGLAQRNTKLGCLRAEADSRSLLLEIFVGLDPVHATIRDQRMNHRVHLPATPAPKNRKYTVKLLERWRGIAEGLPGSPNAKMLAGQQDHSRHDSPRQLF